MLEVRNLDEAFGKLERVWEKRVGPLNEGKFSKFRGLRIIFNKTLQIRFYSHFPKKSLKIVVKTSPPRCDIACPPPNNRWYAVYINLRRFYDYQSRTYAITIRMTIAPCDSLETIDPRTISPVMIIERFKRHKCR